MGLLDFIKKKPQKFIFMKEFDESSKQKEQLESLLDKVGDDQKDLVKRELDLINIGISGEKKVYFELKNIYDILGYVFHDVSIKYNENRCQFDFILITKKYICVIETKKLYGDIEVDKEGNFNRIYKDAKGNVYKKEGMDSPVSQNQKHIDLLRHFLDFNKLLKGAPILSLICCSNEKTIIKKAYAPKNIQDIVIKTDQLSNKIKLFNQIYQDNILSKKNMEDIVELINKSSDDYCVDYVKKLRLNLIETKTEKKIIIDEETKEEKIEEIEIPIVEQNDGLYEALKTYRLNKSKEKNIKAYMIFNNDQLEKLVLKRPLTLKDFEYSKILWDNQMSDYGNDILNIILSFSEHEVIEKQLIENNPIYIKLKAYRYSKSLQLNIKPYMIFNNNQLNDIVAQKPKNLNDLLKVDGFGDIKCTQYGADIIKIVIANDK